MHLEDAAHLPPWLPAGCLAPPARRGVALSPPHPDSQGQAEAPQPGHSQLLPVPLPLREAETHWERTAGCSLQAVPGLDDTCLNWEGACRSARPPLVRCGRNEAQRRRGLPRAARLVREETKAAGVPRAPDPSPFLCPMSPLFYLPSASSRSMWLVPWKMFLRPGTFTDCSQEKQVQEAGLHLLSPGNLSGQDPEFHTGGAFQTRKTHLGFRRVQ